MFSTKTKQRNPQFKKNPECFWSQLTVYDSENFEVRNEPSTLHVVNIKTLMAFNQRRLGLHVTGLKRPLLIPNTTIQRY